MVRGIRAARTSGVAFFMVVASLTAIALPASAAVPGSPSRAVRTIESTDLGVDQPVAMISVPDGDTLGVVGGGDATTLVRFTTTEDRLGSVTLDTGVAASGLITLDARGDRVLMYDRSSVELIALPAATARDGVPGASVRASADGLRLGDVRGIASDSLSGALLVLDAAGRRIVRVDPEPGGGGPLGDLIGGRRSFVALQGVPGGDLTGLAVHPHTGHLYVFGVARNELYQVDRSGRHVATYSLNDLGVTNPAAMAFAPSGDPTDDASITDLYIADRGGAPAPALESSRLATSDAAGPASGPGGIIEVSFEVLAIAPTSDTGTLVQTIDTSQWSPPSPDPAGIAYIPATDRLLVSDSEVNEMTIYAGTNLFTATRAGLLTGQADTTGFTKEPTGLGYNPANGHLFISDDDKREIYEVDPGPDGTHGTGDDVVTPLSVAGFGSTDPEDIAYDSRRDEVLVIDGLGREVYRISRGPNGVFDGIDDASSSFDVLGYGLNDPEGITYDPVRDTIWVGDRADLVIEVTTDGQLLRTIDISAANALNPSAVELAPGSTNPAQRTLWIADRAVDNGANPNENDGKLYELAYPAPSGNLPPSVNAGADQSIILPSSAALDGTVSDDGLPASPGLVTTQWSVVAGPGPVTFDDPSAVDVTATFIDPGLYVLQLSGDDGDAAVVDRVTIEVFSASGPFTVTSRVAASLDDAEEQPSGAMWLDSSDLELTFDGGGHQQVGLRFLGISVPNGATIVDARIQFQVDEPNSETTNLLIQGQAADNPPNFAATNPKISQRARTAASVTWDPVPWLTVGEAGPDQRTPNLAPIIQELIARPGWVSGNAMVLVVSGTGERTAVSYDGSAGGAPLLEIVYTLPTGPPTVAVVASDETAAEAGVDPGSFLVYRTGSTAGDVTVAYTVGGTATPGADYAELTGWVTIPDSSSSAAVTVAPVDDADPEPTETVVLTLAPDAAYVIGSPDSATVTIADDDGNLAPTVDAGADQTIFAGDVAFVRGLVGDDGLPVPVQALSFTWSKLSGPGSVTFARADELLTTASFGAVGSYVLQLTVGDGEFTVSDTVTITVAASPASTIRVPQDHATIQAAIDASAPGAMILVAPGTYTGSLYIPHTLTLASEFYTSGDPAKVAATEIVGTNLATETIVVSGSTGLDTKIVGFTIRDGKDGVVVRGGAQVLSNRVIGQATDAVDFDIGAAGYVSGNELTGNGDEGVDFVDAFMLVENNTITANAGDGFEIRAWNQGPNLVAFTIRDNVISDNLEDGIQLIDNDAVAPTTALMVVDRNLIRGNAQAGIGLMDNAETDEDYRAASLLERIHVFNNTFVGNAYGISGGDNLYAVNNIFLNHPGVALKQVDGASQLAYNLVWGNGVDNEGSNVDPGSTISADPLLDASFMPQAGSGAIDAGTAVFDLASGERILDIPPNAYSGAAPDIGAYEGASNTVRFAVIGDYGDTSFREAAVADMVDSWGPDFVTTTGDNSYEPLIDEAVGPYYQHYIGDYVGAYGPGSPTNRFFPTIGNHDYTDLAGGIGDYLAYFTLPGDGVASTGTSGNERYYDFVWGPVHFFMLNSNSQEPDGTDEASPQASWLQAQLAASTSPWKIVMMHHPPYTSGAVHGSDSGLQWPFAAWGADLVIAGHEHVYERISGDGIVYFVNAIGGSGTYPLDAFIDGSEAFYNAGNGAMLIEACATGLQLSAYSTTDGLVDTYELGVSDCGGSPVNHNPTVDAGPDLAVTAPDAVGLSAVVNDDGLPSPSSLTVTWEAIAGPGVVSFADPNGVATTASFSDPGRYTLRITVDDGAKTGRDHIDVIVSGPGVITARIASGSDDAEETLADGQVSVGSTTLELGADGAEPQAVGLRFRGIAIPRGATITAATIEFDARWSSTATSTLNIRGHAADDAPSFSSTLLDISSRPSTTAAVPWQAQPWSTIGADYATPDISSVVQEIIDRPGWASGNALALLITGSGQRTARSFDLSPWSAPLLTIEYANPTVTVAASDADAAEAGLDPGEFTVARQGSAAGDLVVHYSVQGSASPGSDYVPLAGSVTIPDGSSSATIVVTPMDDGDVEGSETVILTLTSDPAYVIGIPDTATVTIADDDPGNSPPNAVDDAVDGDFETLLTVDVVANDTDPDGNLDPATTNTTCPGCFEPGSGQLVNNGDGTFDYTPDSGFTGSDVFLYQVCDTGGLCDTATVTITIQPPPPSVSVGSPSVVEGAGSLVFGVSLDAVSGVPVEVTFAVTGGSATAGVDYTPVGSVVVSFAPGEVSQSVVVPVVGDDVAEGDESVIVGLSAPVNAVIGVGTGVGTIVDDDAVGVVVSPVEVTVVEGGGGVEYSVVLASEPVDEVTVAVGVALGEVGVSPSVLVFGPGVWDVAQAVTVTAVDDAVADGTTGDVVSHVVSSPDPGYDGFVVDDVAVTVLDNEGAPAVSIGDASVVEGDAGTTTMSFTLLLSPASDTPVTVSVATGGGDATADVDYTPIASGTATFAPGTTSTTVSVGVIGDTLDELDETFVVTLSTPTGGAVIGDATAVGTIFDDDLPVVTIVASDPFAAEQGLDSGEFVVSRQGLTTADLVVGYTVGGDAAAGVDYAALSGSVTIPAGAPSAAIAITPIDDGDTESDEAVTLTLVATSQYAVGSPASASVTIADNDGATSVDYTASSETTPTGSVTAGSYVSTHVSDDVAEALQEASSGGPRSRRVSSLEHRWSFNGIASAESATFTVEARRSVNGENDDFRFEYSLDGGSTFQAFVPALIVSNTVADLVQTRSLPDGVSGTVIVRAVDTDRTQGRGATDTLYVDHLLIATAGGSGAPIVSVTADDPAASESGDPGRFRLTRTVADGSLTVAVGIGGTATPGSDYQTLAGTVVFAAGAAVAYVDVFPLDDGVVEGSETVVLSLLPGAGYVLGTPASATVTIADDDQTVTVTTASAQTTSSGSVTGGTMASTFVEDDVYQVISEELYGGGSRSRLEHRWTFELGTAGASTLYLDAYHTPASENFTFAYSTDGSTWTTMFAVTKTADNDQLQTFVLPAGLTGSVFVRVTDVNRNRGDSDVTSIYVDALYIRTVPS